MTDYELKINELKNIIADAERRVGQYILASGNPNNNYVKKQKEIIEKASIELGKLDHQEKGE